jgi:hypothetical protein
VNGFARFSRADDYPAGVPTGAANAVLDQVSETWGNGRMSALLGPSVASAPGMTEWYGRLERFAASPGTALARMRAILELDVREVLPLVTAPALVIQNLGDLYVRSGHGRYLAEHIPDRRCSSAAAPTTGPSRSLHTGEVTQRDRDVAGLAVHIGARVSAAAAPRRGARGPHRPRPRRRLGDRVRRPWPLRAQGRQRLVGAVRDEQLSRATIRTR